MRNPSSLDIPFKKRYYRLVLKYPQEGEPGLSGQEEYKGGTL